MYGVPPGAETIEEQALREASIFQFKLAQKLSRFFNAAFLSLMLVRSINQWLQYFINSPYQISKAREKAERERKIKEIEEARARVSIDILSEKSKNGE